MTATTPKAKKAARPKIVWRGASSLRRGLVAVADLQPDPDNPRRGNVEAVAGSLRRFGQARPVVVDAAQPARIVAGHHIRLAAIELGWTHVAVQRVEFAGDDERRAFMLADNRTHDLGDYDAELLLAQVRRVGTSENGLDGTGFGSIDLRLLERDVEIASRAAQAQPPEHFPDLDPDELKTDYRCPSCAYEWSGNPKPGGDAGPEAEPPAAGA